MAIPSPSLASKPAMISTENNDPASEINGRTDREVPVNEKANNKMDSHPNGPLSIATASPKAIMEFSASPASMTHNDPDAAINEIVNRQSNGHENGQADPPSVTNTSPKLSVDMSGSSTATDSDERPADFTGDVNTNNEIPTQKVLKSVEDMPLLDKDGKTVPFKSLYSGPNGARRVLVIFIRHFFCGNCQEYLRTLRDSITPDDLLALPTPTFIAVVGHGSPSLISMCYRETKCPFPIYADPTKRLYNELGMVRTLKMGLRPDYQRRGTAKNMFESIRQGVFNLKSGKALQGLDWQQVGGEFLFEPVDISTPIASPDDEVNKQLDGSAGYGYVEEKRITWCHRMKNTRDHAELPELREVLGLDGAGNAGKDRKRWTKALTERKGTGFSTITNASVTTPSGESSERQSVSVEREKAADALNGVNGKEKNELEHAEQKEIK